MPEISFSHISPNGNYVSMFPSFEKTIREIAKISVKDSHTWTNIFQEYLQEKNLSSVQLAIPLLDQNMESMEYSGINIFSGI